MTAQQPDDAMDITPAGPADVATLLALARAFHAEEGRTLDARGEAAIAAIADGEPLARAWLAWMANRAIGYLVLTIGYSVEYGGRDGFIDDLYVVPDVRGRGLGGQLIELAIREARLLGIRTLHLEVEADNGGADRLYRGAGFEATGRRLMRRRIVP
jgi:ribosomal protein S18 acetylase RimI-like enzyme